MADRDGARGIRQQRFVATKVDSYNVCAEGISKVALIVYCSISHSTAVEDTQQPVASRARSPLQSRGKDWLAASCGYLLVSSEEAASTTFPAFHDALRKNAVEGSVLTQQHYAVSGSQLVFPDCRSIGKKQRIPMAWTLTQGLPRRRATGAYSQSLQPSTQLHRHRPAALPQRDHRPSSQSRRHEEAWFGTLIHAAHRGLLRLLLPESGFPAGPGLQIRRGDWGQGAVRASERLSGAVQCECQSPGRVAAKQRGSGAGAARHRGGIWLGGSVRQSEEESQVYIFHGPNWWTLGF